MTKTCQMVWLLGWSEGGYPDVEAAWRAALGELVLVELDPDERADPRDNSVARKLVERDEVVVSARCEPVVTGVYEAIKPWIAGKEENTPEIVKRFDLSFTFSLR